MILALQTPGYGETSAPSNLPTANSTSLAAVTQTTITLFLGIAVIIAVILLVWSGIQWITSEGDQEKISQAKKRIAFIIIGLILIFGAFFILSSIGYVFGINLLGS